jgi:hypothetical protein
VSLEVVVVAVAGRRCRTIEVLKGYPRPQISIRRPKYHLKLVYGVRKTVQRMMK